MLTMNERSYHPLGSHQFTHRRMMNLTKFTTQPITLIFRHMHRGRSQTAGRPEGTPHRGQPRRDQAADDIKQSMDLVKTPITLIFRHMQRGRSQTAGRPEGTPHRGQPRRDHAISSRWTSLKLLYLGEYSVVSEIAQVSCSEEASITFRRARPLEPQISRHWF
jgi:hypothetical protein